MAETLNDIKLDLGGITMDKIVEKLDYVTKRHALGDGAYCRWLWDSAKGGRQLGINEYGCADAINILYTIGRLPDRTEQKKMADALLSLRKEDGSWREVTHQPLHTTAHCIAALQILDANPVEESGVPCDFLKPYRTKEGLYGLLENLKWETSSWDASHNGAGVYTAMQLTGCADMEWQNWYFGWLWDHTDPVYGMSKAGTIGYAPNDPGRLDQREVHPEAKIVCNHLYGWFHYMFNMEYARRPLRYPEKLIDTCLHLWAHEAEGALMGSFGRSIGFREIDWVFALNRATRQTPHRFMEAKQAMADFAVVMMRYLDTLDENTHDTMNDLHALFGTVCVLAELQAALPGKLDSTQPLRLVLDRRPFI